MPLLRTERSGERAVASLRAVLPRQVAASLKYELEPRRSDCRWDAVVWIAGQLLTVEWLSDGTLPAIRSRLEGSFKSPDVIVAPKFSPGAQEAAVDAGIGWVDETGAAEISFPFLVVSRSSVARPVHTSQTWTKGALAVAEALLEGVRPTVSDTVAATKLSTGAAAKSLAFLQHEGLLVSGSARGPNSARELVDPGALLNRYVAAARTLRPRAEIQVGVLWRDPVEDAIRLGRAYDQVNVIWAATSALAAAVLAPFATQVAPLVIYVDGATVPQLTGHAAQVGLAPIQGGRLTLRPFPTRASQTLRQLQDDLMVVPWARCYADLQEIGVRGEDIAANIRETKIDVDS